MPAATGTGATRLAMPSRSIWMGFTASVFFSSFSSPGFCSPGFAASDFLSSFFFSLFSFGFERGGLVRLKGEGEHAVGRIVVEAVIELADARVEITSGNEIDVFAVVVEDGIIVAVEAGGDFRDFLGVERIEENIVGAAAMRLRISNPKAVGGPGSVLDEAVFGGIHEDRLLIVEAHIPELVGLVPVDEFFAVGGPGWAKAIDFAVCCDARFLAAHLRACVEFVLASFVGQIGDRLAVRRPSGIEFVDAGVLGR